MTITQSLVKEQLIEFVEDHAEPFDLRFIMASCNTWIDEQWIRRALSELEEEGQIVRLNHHYLATRTARRRWFPRPRQLPFAPQISRSDLPPPSSVLHEFRDLLTERPDLGYLDTSEFIRDALRRRIHQLENKNET